MATWWGAGARDATFLGHLWAQYNTSAALLPNAPQVRDPLQFTAALPMPTDGWEKQEVHGPGEGKCTHVSLRYASLFGMCYSALLSTTGDFCITFFELPCLCHWTVSFSAHRALGGSISNDLTIMHLPLKISTLAASKECPGDGNTASSKGRSCHQKGNGVARCSAWVRWRHVLRTTTATTEQISVWSMHPNFFSVGIMAKGIWRGMILPSGSSRMKLGINDMLKPKPPPFFLLFNFCHRLFL